MADVTINQTIIKVTCRVLCKLYCIVDMICDVNHMNSFSKAEVTPSVCNILDLWLSVLPFLFKCHELNDAVNKTVTKWSMLNTALY